MKKTSKKPTFWQKTASVLKWIWENFVKLIMLIAQLTQWTIANFGKAIVWIWSLSILTLLVAAIAFYLFATGTRNLDNTRWNELILEKTAPLIEKELEIEVQREIQRIENEQNR